MTIMLVSIVVVASSLLSVATALPAVAAAAAAVNYNDWRKPGPNDVRSPCPALNSLANHGILPRNGRNLTLPILLAGLGQGLNLGDDATTLFWAGGVLASPNPLGGAFDLSDIVKHNFPIEHDASLSRVDAFFGNQQPFDQNTWNQFVKTYDGKSIATIPDTSKGKYVRVTDSRARNPTFQYGLREYILSYGEAALFLSIMGNPNTGDAPVNFVKIFFQQERLPYKEGWRPPTQPTTLLSVGSMINRLVAAGPEPLPEGVDVITMGAIRKAFGGLAVMLAELE